MISALRGLFWLFDVGLKSFDFRFSLGGCHAKLEVGRDSTKKVEIYKKKNTSFLVVNVCFQDLDRWRARVGGGRLYESPRAVNMVDGLPRAPSRKFADKIKNFSKSKLGVGHRSNFLLLLRS